MASAGGIEYHVRAILQIDKAGKSSKAMTAFADGLVNAGTKVQGAGRAIMGNSAAIAAGMLKTGALMAGGLAAMGILGGIAKAIQLNVELENQTFAVASSLQLMARNGGDFTKNMEESAWIMAELEKRAATSPASFEQAQELFRNMLPGAIMVTGEMDKILNMAEAALTLGIQMGGDFKQAGADLRRIMTGQAGADVRVWQEGFGKAISDIATEKGGKLGAALGGATGEALTKTFNKLDPLERFALVEAAVMRLGPATKFAATSWQGLTSTVQTLGVWLLRIAGGQAFDRIKARLAKWSDPNGEGLFGKAGKDKMERMARVVGVSVGNLIDRALNGFERVFGYVSDNWESILNRFHDIVQGIKTAAKLAVVAGAGRTVTGAGVMAAGGAVKGIGGLLQAAPGFMEFVKSVGGLGVAAAVALPLVLLLAVVMGGLGIVAAGGMAYFIDQIDALRTGLEEGSIVIDPLFEAMGLLWWRMTEMGGAIFGVQDPINGANDGIMLMANLLDSLAGGMAFTLRALWLVQFGWNALTAGLKIAYLAIFSVVQGLLWLVQQAMSVLPAIAGGGVLDNTMEKMAEHSTTIQQSIQTDANEGASTKLLEGADALENYKAGLGEGVRTKLEGAFGRPGAGGAMGADDKKPPGRPSSTTTIHKVVVNQDLRGENPDRVIGHFNKALKQASQRRNSPFTGAPESS